MTPARHPQVGIWGTFDVANFGDLLFPRIFEAEVKRRLPHALVRSFSPLGYLHSVPLDGGFVAEPLGPWTPERVAELARDLDFVAVGGGEIIHDRDEYFGIWYDIDATEAESLLPSRFFIEGLGQEAEATTPVAWHSVGIPFDLEGELADRVRTACARRPYISVRDEHSRARLARAGVEREVAVVPDSALLVERLFSRDLLERRLRYLRAVGAFPEGTAPLVVQGSRVLLPHVEEIGRALADALNERDPPPVLLLEVGPCHGDGEFADAIARFLPGDVYRLSEAFVVEDIVAAIAHSRGFVGVSLHGSLTAFTFGVPFSTLNLAGYSKLDAFAELADAEATLVKSPRDLGPAIARVLGGRRAQADIGPLVRRVDAHFDHLAELAEQEAARHLDHAAATPSSSRALEEALMAADQRYNTLRTAYDARSRAFVCERIRLTELIQTHERRADAEHLLGELERARIALADASGELERLREDLGRSEHARDAAELALSVLSRSRVFRYSAPLRQAWARVRSAGFR